MKKYDISRTTVLKAKKTAVLVFMPGLVDRSWSRTVPTLPQTWYWIGLVDSISAFRPESRWSKSTKGYTPYQHVCEAWGLTYPVIQVYGTPNSVTRNQH